MGRRVHTDTIIMVRTTECMISMIYVVVNINEYKIKLSLPNNVVAIGVGVGGVVVGYIIISGGGALATTVDISMGATVTADDDDAVRAVIPSSLTNDEDAYVGVLVAFEGVCISVYADGARESTAASALLPPRCRRCTVRQRSTSHCRHRRCRQRHAATKLPPKLRCCAIMLPPPPLTLPLPQRCRRHDVHRRHASRCRHLR